MSRLLFPQEMVIPIENLLSYTKQSVITNSLVRLLVPDDIPIACSIFKVSIPRACGDNFKCFHIFISNEWLWMFYVSSDIYLYNLFYLKVFADSLLYIATYTGFVLVSKHIIIFYSI